MKASNLGDTQGHAQQKKSLIQAVEMGFLHMVAGVSRIDRLRNSLIWERVKIEPLLLSIES